MRQFQVSVSCVAFLLVLALIFAVQGGGASAPAPAPCGVPIEQEGAEVDPYDGLADVLREMVCQGGLLRVLCNLKPETSGCDRLPGPRPG